MKLDVKIMASPTRTKYLESMLKSLDKNDDIIVYDDRKEVGSAMYNARRCWKSKLDTNITHRLVLQDDLELCNDFLSNVQNCIEIFPNAIWSLYSSRITYNDQVDKTTPYVSITGNGVHGQAVIIPVQYIKPLFEWIDKTLGKEYPHDDCAIGTYANINNIPVFTTVPSMVQHLGHSDSVLKYNNKNKISKVYIGKDLSHVEWQHFWFSKTPRIIKNNLYLK